MSSGGERSTAQETVAISEVEEFEQKTNSAFTENCDKTFSRFKFTVHAEVGAKGLQTEGHTKRMILMRKELLHFIKETDWQFEPVEKRAAQQ